MLVDSSSLGLHDTIEPFLKFYYLYTDLLSFIFCLLITLHNYVVRCQTQTQDLSFTSLSHYPQNYLPPIHIGVPRHIGIPRYKHLIVIHWSAK